MMMCARCHKRVAVIFLTKLENGESKQEGLCLKCAKELGIKPIDDIIAQTGLDDETIERLNSEMDEFMETAMTETENGDEPQTRTPFLNFSKLMNEGSRNSSNPSNPAKKRKGEEKDKDKPKEGKKDKKKEDK